MSKRGSNSELFAHENDALTLFWGWYFDLVFGGGGGGKITSPILTAVLVVQLSSNLVRMSNCQSVLNFWKKKSKSLMTSSLFFGKNVWNFFFFFFSFLEMIFKQKTIFFFFLMTWLDKWQQGRTHIRHILFKFLTNLCYIKIIKVIKFGDKIFNRTKVINKNLEGEVILPPPPPKKKEG